MDERTDRQTIIEVVICIQHEGLGNAISVLTHLHIRVIQEFYMDLNSEVCIFPLNLTFQPQNIKKDPMSHTEQHAVTALPWVCTPNIIFFQSINNNVSCQSMCM